MSYIVTQDLIDELGEKKLIQLTDNDGADAVNEARVDKAIAYGEGTFDSYARTRYTIPVTATPRVKATVLDLAVFHLYKSRSSVDDGVYKVRKDAHDAALKFLHSLADGRAALDVPSADETVSNPQNPDQVLKGNSNPQFSDRKLRSW